MGFSEIGYAYEFSTAVHRARLMLPGVCESICITFLSSLTALSHLRLPVHINFPLIVEYRKHLQATHEKLFFPQPAHGKPVWAKQTLLY